MGILGLTHDVSDSALEKLPITIKVAIGEGLEPDSQTSQKKPPQCNTSAEWALVIVGILTFATRTKVRMGPSAAAT